jgi:NADH-quinone oxidoreductase subunit N
MEIVLLKSFIPETFFSLSILLQLLFNTRSVNFFKFNFPIIDKEVITQIFCILTCLLLLLLNLNIEGFFSNHLFLNDNGTKFLKIIILGISISSLGIISTSFSTQRLNFFEFYTLFLFSLLSLFLLVSSYDCISFYLAMEMQTLCFYVLSTFNRSSTFSTEAGLKYFISGSFFSGFFLFGASLIYGCLGTLSIYNISLLLSYAIHSVDVGIGLRYLIDISMICILVTLLFKIGCVPFHFWLPDVYDGAPLSATIIFSIIPKIAIFCFFIRIISSMHLFFLDVKEILLFFGVLSTFFGTFFALSQTRFKRLVIYSSIAQIGFLVVALAMNSLQSFTSMYFFLFIYLLSSILLWGYISVFLSFQSKIYQFYSKISSSLLLSSLTNFFQLNSLWSFSFAIILFSIAGIPPLTGFLGKIMILIEVVNANFIFSAITLMIISSVSVFYYIKFLKLIFFEPKSSNLNFEHFQIVSTDSSLNFSYLVFAICLLFLFLTFFSPSLLLLLCHYITLTSVNF